MGYNISTSQDTSASEHLPHTSGARWLRRGEVVKSYTDATYERFFRDGARHDLVGEDPPAEKIKGRDARDR